MNLIQTLHDAQQSSIASLSDKIIAEIKADLDSRSIGGGEVSINRLTTLLQPFRDELNRLHERLSEGTQGNRTQNQSSQDEAANIPIHYIRHEWGVRWRRLPEGWTFNRKMSVLSAW